MGQLEPERSELASVSLYTNWGWPGGIVVEGDQGHVVVHHLKLSAVEIHTVHFNPRQL